MNFFQLLSLFVDIPLLKAFMLTLKKNWFNDDNCFIFLNKIIPRRNCTNTAVRSKINLLISALQFRYSIVIETRLLLNDIQLQCEIKYHIVHNVYMY